MEISNKIRYPLSARGILRELRHLGLIGTCSLHRGERFCNGVFQVRDRRYEHPFFLRAGTTDSWIFRENILAGEYSIVPDSLAPKRIIDAGANAGFSARYFSNKWPDAEIVAIEPDRENFQMAERNTSCCPNVRVIMGGLACSVGHGEIRNQSNWKFSLRTEVCESGSVEMYSVASILAKMNWDSVDLIKIDIEGGELDLFSSSTSWMAQTKGIVIELHENFAPGCTQALFKALSTHRFTLAWRGENLLVLMGD